MHGKTRASMIQATLYLTMQKYIQSYMVMHDLCKVMIDRAKTYSIMHDHILRRMKSHARDYMRKTKYD